PGPDGDRGHRRRHRLDHALARGRAGLLPGDREREGGAGPRLRAGREGAGTRPGGVSSAATPIGARPFSCTVRPRMWVDRDRSWIQTVALGGFALPHIWTRTITVTAISVITTILYEEIPQLHYSLTPTPFTLVGLPLGIFLGF